MTDHESDARGSAMLEACFDRTAAHAAALALARGIAWAPASPRWPAGWLRVCLRRFSS